MPINQGGARALKKSLPVFFLIDVSGSMGGSRIAAVNEAMDKIVPKLKEFAADEASIEFTVRVITYGAGSANWKVGDKMRGIPVEQFDWLPISDSEIDGGTPADKALALLSTVMGNDYREYLGGYIGTPLIIIISDGYSNGSTPFTTAVDNFRATKVGDRCVQVAIGIETNGDERATQELTYFGKNGFRHCTENPEEIIKLICTATLKSVQAATGASRRNDGTADSVGDVFDTWSDDGN